MCIFAALVCSENTDTALSRESVKLFSGRNQEMGARNPQFPPTCHFGPSCLFESKNMGRGLKNTKLPVPIITFANANFSDKESQNAGNRIDPVAREERVFCQVNSS